MRFLLLALFCAACSNAVDPYERGATEGFAVYGFLDTDLAEQVVRIEPVAPLIPRDTSRIRVVLRDEATAIADTMRPQLTVSEDGSPILIYRSRLPVELGRSYTLIVEAPGLAETIARAATPPLRPASFLGSAGDSLLLLAGEAAPPSQAILRYVIAGEEGPVNVAIPYVDGRSQAGGYVFPLLPARDRRVLLSTAGLARDETLRILSVTVEVQDAGPEWRQPALPNITNGFGFFSSISRSRQEVTLPDSLRAWIEAGR